MEITERASVPSGTKTTVIRRPWKGAIALALPVCLNYKRSLKEAEIEVGKIEAMLRDVPQPLGFVIGDLHGNKCSTKNSRFQGLKVIQKRGQPSLLSLFTLLKATIRLMGTSPRAA